MDIETLKNKKKNLSELLSRKVAELQNIENARNQFTTEIIEMRGKLALLEEILKEEIPK